MRNEGACVLRSLDGATAGVSDGDAAAAVDLLARRLRGRDDVAEADLVKRADRRHDVRVDGVDDDARWRRLAAAAAGVAMPVVAAATGSEAWEVITAGEGTCV